MVRKSRLNYGFSLADGSLLSNDSAVLRADTPERKLLLYVFAQGLHDFTVLSRRVARSKNACRAMRTEIRNAYLLVYDWLMVDDPSYFSAYTILEYLSYKNEEILTQIREKARRDPTNLLEQDNDRPTYQFVYLQTARRRQKKL